MRVGEGGGGEKRGKREKQMFAAAGRRLPKNGYIGKPDFQSSVMLLHP